MNYKERTPILKARVEQVLILVEMVKGEAMRLGKNELAEYMGAPQHAYYMGMMDALVALDLLEIDLDHIDQRKQLLKVTVEGYRILDKLRTE
jgi:hypothetical protein